MADRIGQTLGKYRLTHLLGQGGFAEVYLGVHIHLGTQAAIKLLHALLATPGEIEKFRQEAQIIAGLVHPNIVRVLDFDVEEGTPYLVLDYAPNGSLRSRLPAGAPQPLQVVLPYLTQVAEGLQYAHDQKLIHRDIKPENMLLGRRNEVLLGDFGIATAAQNTSLQKTQGVAGTTAYMAPEQLQGKPRLASDLYSLGVVVYEWLTGERPFQGAPMEVASQHVLTPPPPLREKVPTLPPALEQVVLTALAKDPKDRFGSVRAFANAFRQACQVSVSTATFATMLATMQQATGGQPVISPISQSGDAISSATTHVTPSLTPQFSNPQVSAAQTGQGPSVFDAPTQVTPPLAATGPMQAITGSQPSWGNTTAGANVPPGWANQVTPATGSPGGPPPPIAATWEGPAGGSLPTPKPVSWSDAPTAAETHAPPVALPQENEQARRKGGLRRWALAIAASLVVLVLLGGGAAYAFTHLAGVGKQTGPTAATSATVTITPKSSDLKDVFTIQAVIGTPDISKQVGARQLSATTPAQSQTVNATGTRQILAARATGTLLFFTNLGGFSYPVGTIFSGNSGVQVAIDAAVNFPSNPGANQTIRVPAHAVNPGSGGNIPAGDINQGSNGVFSCPIGTFAMSDLALLNGQQTGVSSSFLSPNTPLSGSTNVVCNTRAFSGGRDASTSPVVAQSDIDTAANNLINQNQPNAQQVLQGQLRVGEQLIGQLQCNPVVSANHQAGDAAKTVTVTVSFTCTGEAYDQAGALALAKTLLTNEAQSKFGAAYALSGQIKTSQVNATQDGQGNVTVTVNGEGIWVYQFSDTQKAQLASLIAGKTKAEATQLLSTQPGVAQVTITLPSSMGELLPTDTTKIMIVIQPVAGA